jgi:hypothetical protein
MNKPSLRKLLKRPHQSSAVNPIDAFAQQVQSHWENHFGGGIRKDDLNPAKPASNIEQTPSNIAPTQPEPQKSLAVKLKPKVRSYSLLTDEAANTKTSKNARSEKYQSAILHLAPSDLSGIINTCPGASEGCRQACLNSAGRGGLVTEAKPLNTVQQARVRRTSDLAKKPDVFFNHLHKDINKIVKIAQKENKHPVVRLNGTSDLDWAKFRPAIWGGKNVFEAFPNVQFYDYTKMPGHVLKNTHPNYHLTFSRSEKNESLAKNMLAKGHNVAVVFGGKALPKTYLGRPVISGDNDDLRFLDPKDMGGYVIGLTAKGDAKSDHSGFVVWGHEGDPASAPTTKDKKSAIIHAALKEQQKP